MTFTIVNTGVDFLIQNWLNKNTQSNLTLHLYTNNHTPAFGDAVGSYTECALSGYASVTFSPSSWTGSSTGGLATYTYPGQTFTFSSYAGGTTIYGAYITNSGGTLVAAALLDTAFAVPAAGGSVTINMTATE